MNLGLWGLGIGEGFGSTDELHVMKFTQAMVSADYEKWGKAVQNEFEIMECNGVFTQFPQLQCHHRQKFYVPHG